MFMDTKINTMFGSFLCQKYKEAMKGITESASAFDKLKEIANPIMVATWEEQDRYAHSCQVANPLVMDACEVQLKRAPTWKQQELALLSSQVGQLGGNLRQGAATWIASGITIEEMQITLTMDTRRLGRHPMETQTLDICSYQTKLQSQIDQFTIMVATHLGKGFDIDDEIRDLHLDFMDNNSEDEGINGSDIESEPEAHGSVHPAKSQAKSMRVWTQVHSVERVIQLNTMIYMKCQTQLRNLEAHGLLNKYLWMDKSHLKTTAAVADLNAWGQ
ncbi:hypothetical protein BDR06DRAFT_969458 [Suillus hirtellus]|nr:hypothetical protein BDR06DRAFT_969458 [Suillus hirtellus]